MPNSLGIHLEVSEGRRFVISDIHGCIHTLETLLTKLQITPTDQVFFLGDYIHKGTRSRATLELILSLSSLPNYYPLIGNHEQLLLDHWKESGNENYLTMLTSLQSEFLGLEASEKSRYFQFLDNLPCYVQSGEYLLVHAGFDFTLDFPFHDRESMLNIRGFSYEYTKSSGKAIVHGHIPKAKNVILQSLAESHPILPLDNGCVYAGKRDGMGELLCLELNSRELIAQPNVDQ